MVAPRPRSQLQPPTRPGKNGDGGLKTSRLTCPAAETSAQLAGIRPSSSVSVPRPQRRSSSSPPIKELDADPKPGGAVHSAVSRNVSRKIMLRILLSPWAPDVWPGESPPPFPSSSAPEPGRRERPLPGRRRTEPIDAVRRRETRPADRVRFFRPAKLRVRRCANPRWVLPPCPGLEGADVVSREAQRRPPPRVPEPQRVPQRHARLGPFARVRRGRACVEHQQHVRRAPVPKPSRLDGRGRAPNAPNLRRSSEVAGPRSTPSADAEVRTSGSVQCLVPVVRPEAPDRRVGERLTQFARTRPGPSPGSSQQSRGEVRGIRR